MRRAKRANYPFHACSLTTVISREAEKRSVVTKSSEGNRYSCNRGITWTRNQSEWRGEDADRRKTNSCRHRKGEPAVIADRAGYIWDRRPSVLHGKSAEMREENGYMHLIAQRCKRRRYVLKTHENNRGEPVSYLGNRIAVKTEYRATAANKSLNINAPATVGIQSKREQARGYLSIRRKAERINVKIQEVGDGYSSEDVRDRITLTERRAISLNKQLTEPKDRRRML